MPGEAKTLLDSLRSMELISEALEDGDLPPDPREMAPSHGPILGIDLGTTNSSCAVVSNGQAVLIPTRPGQNAIPSIVAVNPSGDLVVGHAARTLMESDPKTSIYDSKRLVGRPFDSPVMRKMRDRLHYEIVAGRENRAAAKIDGMVIGLEAAAARILSVMRDAAQEYLGRIVDRAVITVPASYNSNQRLAVCTAGDLAGLKVERILSEPTATAVAYGHKRSRVQKVLVYDLGGGTFDASIVNMYGNVYEVIATQGEAFLGGVDFDNQLMDHIMVEFQLQLGHLPQMERVALLRTLQAAEHAKRTLSESDHTTIRLPFIGMLEGKPVDLEHKISREKLEALVSPLVDRTLQVCELVLRRASIKPEDLDVILLSGGQTRMPMIRRRISERFGTEAIHEVGADESVAVGAALFGDSIGSMDAVVPVDVLPAPIGIGAPDGEVFTVLPAGSKVPTSRTYAVKTFLQDQTEMDLPLFQGKFSRLGENEYLGTVHLGRIRPCPSGNRTILVTFSLTPECLLKVKAVDPKAGPLDEVVMKHN